MNNNKDNEPQRLQKYLAQYGVASRRKIEQLIEAGEITVDGIVAELGCKVTSKNKITIAGKKFNPQKSKQDNITQLLAYHKPVGKVCTSDDPEGRETVYDDLPPLENSKWISIGRLDLNTSGLLLFTNNGELAHKLMHPSSNFDREYLVRVLGEITDQKLRRLLAGVELDDGKAKFKSIAKLKNRSDSANQWFKVVLTEGRKREVRRLWEAVDCKVSRLTRIRFGPYTLPRDLRPGETCIINDIIND